MPTLIASAAATWAMVGLIWTIQLVHYPLMGHVTSGFRAFHAAHTSRITWVVGPLMGLELVTAIALVGSPPAGVSKGAAVLALALVLVCWGATAIFSVPAHERLGSSFDAEALARLVSTNWIRTVAWTARGVLMGWLLHQAFLAARA